MVLIRQHGLRKELYDINVFLTDIDSHFEIDEWVIDIEWCLGEGASEIEEESNGGKKILNEEFRALYKEIYQTIDGKFDLFSKQELVATLEAVDSSFWKISSPNNSFEKHMEDKYGKSEFNNT